MPSRYAIVRDRSYRIKALVALRKILKTIACLPGIELALRLNVHFRFHLGSTGRPHGLPGPLVISLTSHPRRFPTLHLTLRSLLRQTIIPDEVVLVVSQADIEQMPTDIGGLSERLRVMTVGTDLKSYNKLVPVRLDFPSAFVVTADDDVW